MSLKQVDSVSDRCNTETPTRSYQPGRCFWVWLIKRRQIGGWKTETLRYPAMELHCEPTDAERDVSFTGQEFAARTERYALGRKQIYIGCGKERNRKAKSHSKALNYLGRWHLPQVLVIRKTLSRDINLARKIDQ